MRVFNPPPLGVSTPHTSPTTGAKSVLFALLMKTYQCIVCGYIYDEAQGWPQDGILAGTKWEDVPDTWVCPDCGVGKADFEMVEI